MLVPSRIPNLTGIVDKDAVPWGNSSGAVYALDFHGSRWVRKPVAASEMLAESLGWLLSRQLHVPTPDAAVTGTAGHRSWLSALVEPALHWESSRAERMRSVDHLGAMIGLDAITGNSDRHAANILFRPRNSGELDLLSIDLANAWIGSPALLDAKGLEPPELGSLVDDLPVDLASPGALALAREAAALPEEAIAEAVREACNIAGFPNIEPLRTAMVRRCGAAPEIVVKYLKLLEFRA